MLFIFTFVFAFLSLFIYVEFGWKTYVLVDCNPGMRCKANINRTSSSNCPYYYVCTLCVKPYLFLFPESLIFTSTLTLQHNIQHPPSHIWILYTRTCMHTHTHADYYRVYQVFMSVIKLFLLFLVRWPFVYLAYNVHASGVTRKYYFFYVLGDIQCDSRCADPAT